MEKVLSCTSSGFSFFERARSARSFMLRWMPRIFFSSALFTTAQAGPSRGRTAMRRDLLVQDDVGSVERGVQCGVCAQSRDGGLHEEGIKVSLVS